jgi:hypothetical protein
MRPPSPLDAAVLRVIEEELTRHASAATVRQDWSEGARMWFVEVEPNSPGAARLSVGFDGDDDVSVTVGHTWFELFPFNEASLDDLRRIVRAVFAGHIEEAGTQRDGAGRARIYTDRGPRTVGAASLLPWRLSKHRQYQPYALSLTSVVEALLYRRDPIGINFGDNPDEYEPYAETIVARLPECRSIKDMRAVVHEEFVRWFDEDIAGPASRYDKIAQEIWGIWQETRESP